MDFDLTPAGGLPHKEMYKLLTNVIVPRPIAWVTSMDDAGRVNAAPFSFFNILGSDPPVVAIGVGDRHPGTPKDTARNIATLREFVIHLVTEDLAQAMNVTATDFPYGHSEIDAAGLTLTPSAAVRVPRIEEAASALECRELNTMRVGNNRIILGQVVHLYVRDEFVDADKLYISGAYSPIGRLGSPAFYSRSGDRFELPRISFEEWDKPASDTRL